MSEDALTTNPALCSIMPAKCHRPREHYRHFDPRILRHRQHYTRPCPHQCAIQRQSASCSTSVQ